MRVAKDAKGERGSKRENEECTRQAAAETGRAATADLGGGRRASSERHQPKNDKTRNNEDNKDRAEIGKQGPNCHILPPLGRDSALGVSKHETEDNRANRRNEKEEKQKNRSTQSRCEYSRPLFTALVRVSTEGKAGRRLSLMVMVFLQ